MGYKLIKLISTGQAIGKANAILARIGKHDLETNSEESYNHSIRSLYKLLEMPNLLEMGRKRIQKVLDLYEQHKYLGYIRSWKFIPWDAYKCAKLKMVDGSPIGPGRFAFIKRDAACRLLRDLMSVDLHPDVILTTDGDIVYKQFYYGKMNPEAVMKLHLDDIKRLNLMTVLASVQHHI